MDFNSLKKKYIVEAEELIDPPQDESTLEEFLSTKEILEFGDLEKFIERSPEPTIQRRKVMGYLQAFEAFFREGRYAETIAKGEDVKLDEKELQHGIEVEKEHTANQMIAQKIARDHLTEDSKYYIKLKRMEEGK